jgi:hypothetical protein
VTSSQGLKEQILSDLDRLSPAEQQRAAELVHLLVAPLPKGASVEALLSIAGTLGVEASHEMMQAIDSHCEQVDLDEW